MHNSQRIDDENDLDDMDEGAGAPLVNSDPYYTIRDDVSNQIGRIMTRYRSFQTLLHSVNTSTSADFNNLRKGLARDARSVQKVLSGLKVAVDQVERFRRKFPHIADTELAARKKFLIDTQNVINEVKNGIDAPAVRRKMEDDLAKNGAPPSTAFGGGGVANGRAHAGRNGSSASSSSSSGRGSINAASHDAEEVTRNNDEFIGSSRTQQSTLLRQQDDALLELGSAAERLGDMAGSINEELREQNRMLGALDEELDSAGERMGAVMTQLSKTLKTKDRCQLYTIIVLTLFLMFLIFLVVYT